MEINKYFGMIERAVEEHYSRASEARKAGIDPESQVEVTKARSLAEKAIGLVGALYPQVQDNKIVARILDLEKEFGSLEPAVGLSIAGEVAKEKFCKFESQHEAIEAGARIAIAYMTLGVVSSPIEGFVTLKLQKTAKGEEYFTPYFSGPIRSAGGTEAAFSVVIVDYLRELFGYARYDPTDDEVKRGVHECYEYHERVTNLQYLPVEEELQELMRNLPVQVSGDPSEHREVYNYKDLPRVETNFIRNGFALVMCEAIALKAPKILKRVKNLQSQGFALSDWKWLEGFVELQKKLRSAKTSDGASGSPYIQDIVAGRPVLAHPSESGGFRLRYGRTRNTGYSALAIHPATMSLTEDFIAVGTQLKLEKPTKGCTIASCDAIDGPVVKLYDGSVMSLQTWQEAKDKKKDVAEVLYLGDLLVPYGDLLNRNHPLCRPGYVPQHWQAESKGKGEVTGLIQGLEDAKEISKRLGIPLHPDHIYYWSQISFDDFMALADWLGHGTLGENLLLPFGKQARERFARGKRALEIIGFPHKVTLEHVVISKANTKALFTNLGIPYGAAEKDFESAIESWQVQLPKDGKDVLETVNKLSEFIIKDKAGTFVGARMGRPEKAKLRKLTGSPHVLFPVGNEGGRLRSVLTAVEAGTVKGDFPIFKCQDCDKNTIYPTCETCGKGTRKMKYCPPCDSYMFGNCEEHGQTRDFDTKRINIRHYFDAAKKQTKMNLNNLPVVIKGVRGTSSQDHSCEHLGKGILRAKYDLHVNKDGTIRYDVSEMPLTHFKPKEVGTSIEKLRELGYEKDIKGAALKNEDQVLEIFPHDVVLPACHTSMDEKADDVLLKVSRFIDDELVHLYGGEKFFDHKTKADLPGTFVACISPHNCACVTGRVIGFSKVQALLASPYMHAAMRRDCDGDEAAFMLMMDLLLNFSKHFLPSHRGGTQDAPLVLNTHMRAGEVDDMVFDIDVGKELPLELFESAEKEKHPSDVKMEQIKGRLGTDKEFTDLHCTYEVTDINAAPVCSSYKTLPTMKEKVESQMAFCQKIRAVDISDVARLIIERHFIRDIRGNLRKFSMQMFRCVDCNEKYRRPPLIGRCLKCGGKLIFTISEGSVIKYMQAALDLARTFNVQPYLLECLEITEKDIAGIFGKDKEKQEHLSAWF